MGIVVTAVDTRRVLLESGGICGFPACRTSLVAEPSATEPGAVVAEIAHIIAASREGPRGAEPLTDQERNSSDNLIVLCPTHHKVIDSQPFTYSVPVLRQMKANHLADLRRRLRPAPAPEPLPLVSEVLHSSVLPVSYLPKFVFSAKCAFGPEQAGEVRERVDPPKGREVLLPFVLKSGLLFCFQNLRKRGNAFHNVIDATSVREWEATEMWDNSDDRRLYVQLLNRSLYKYAGHRDVRYDPDHRRFYFQTTEPGKRRTIQYKSVGGRKVNRDVVWQPIKKSTGEARDYWWHVAAGLRFHQVAPLQWCLSIRPEWHLTNDGQTPLASQRIGRRVTSKKSRMYNFQYLSEVNFWRDFLSGGSPRIVLQFDDQAAIVSAEIITVNVKWPGVPGDVKRVDTADRKDDLFSLTELRDVVGDEMEWDEEEKEIESEDEPNE